MKALDLIGSRFGRLTVVARAANAANRQSRWVCMCDCSEQRTIPSNNLRNGTSTSCGCLRTEILVRRFTTHGEAGKSREYNAWRAARNRCSAKPGTQQFKDYVQRGITVCERWSSFELFLRDMGRCPAGLTLDRKNNDGNYEPDNCRWASRHEQMRNTRRARARS